MPGSHFVRGHWILREGRSRQQMLLYPGIMTDERSCSSCKNFGSLTRHFLLEKTSFPVGLTVGINFDNFTCKWNYNTKTGLFSYKKKEICLVVHFALNFIPILGTGMKSRSVILCLKYFILLSEHKNSCNETTKHQEETQPGATFVPGMKHVYGTFSTQT